ncbi:MAG: antibiotic biosynthesis monooxygenase [Hyphomicrobium sp.]
MAHRIAETPVPPNYAVIFTSQRKANASGYNEMAEELERLLSHQDGYLGHESVRDANLTGITVSYWRDESSIRAWKADAQHRLAQKLGHERWYDDFYVRVARVERAYFGPDTTTAERKTD